MPRPTDEDWKGLVVVAAIGVALYIVYLYFLLMQWLFRNVFLDVLVGAALIALIVAPLVYGIGAFRSFRIRQGWRWRDLLWIPIAALLLLMYADLVVLLDSTFASFIDSRYAPDWISRQNSEIQTWLHLVLPYYKGALKVFLHPLVGLNSALPDGTERWAYYAFFALALKITLILVLLLAARGLSSNYEDGKEPAHRQYFFGDAYLDMLILVKKSWSGVAAYYIGGARVMAALFASEASGLTWFVMVFVWPLAIAAILGLFVLPGALGALFLPVMFLIHALALVLVGLLFAGIALLLFLIERSILFVRSRWAKCPHPGCYRTVALPVYRCTCGAKHKHLLPGRYGVFRRQCSGAQAKGPKKSCGRFLPTFSWLGKQGLEAECRYCGGELPHALYSTNLILPIYGGQAAGKTMFKNAGVVQLMDGRQPGLSAKLIVDLEDDDYKHRLRPAFLQGQLPPKTIVTKPPAYLMSLQRSGGLGQRGRPVSLYLFDPDGQVNEAEIHLDQQHYLRHLGGLALLIDPLSLPSLRVAFEATGQPLPKGTCLSKPLDIVERLYDAVREHTGLAADKRFKRRLAVILTKGDMAFVQNELGVSVDGKPPQAAWHGLDHATSQRIRDWLRANEHAFLRALETHFKHVEFFIVSAMGHDATTQRAFQPKRVLEPLLWLLSARSALRRPILTRWGMTAAEVAIVVVLVAAFSILPISAITVASIAQDAVADMLDPSFRIEDDGLATCLAADQFPTRFRDSFTTEESPLTYCVRYKNGQAGEDLLVIWSRNGEAIEYASIDLDEKGDGYVRSPSPLQAGEYEVSVTFGSKELSTHRFSVVQSVPAIRSELAGVRVSQPMKERPSEPLGGRGVTAQTEILQPSGDDQVTSTADRKVQLSHRANPYMHRTKTNEQPPEISPPALRVAIVVNAPKKLSVRAGAGREYHPPLDYLKNGDIVRVKPGKTESDGYVWVEIEADGKSGWVAEKSQTEVYLEYR